MGTVPTARLTTGIAMAAGTTGKVINTAVNSVATRETEVSEIMHRYIKEKTGELRSSAGLSVIRSLLLICVVPIRGHSAAAQVHRKSVPRVLLDRPAPVPGSSWYSIHRH